jgi:hypothetical protein
MRSCSIRSGTGLPEAERQRRSTLLQPLTDVFCAMVGCDRSSTVQGSVAWRLTIQTCKISTMLFSLLKFFFALVPLSGIGNVTTAFDDDAYAGYLRTDVASICVANIDDSVQWTSQTFVMMDQAWANPGVQKTYTEGAERTQAIRIGDELHLRTYQLSFATPVAKTACWAVLTEAEQAELRRQLFCRGHVYGAYCTP